MGSPSKSILLCTWLWLAILLICTSNTFCSLEISAFFVFYSLVPPVPPKHINAWYCLWSLWKCVGGLKLQTTGHSLYCLLAEDTVMLLLMFLHVPYYTDSEWQVILFISVGNLSILLRTWWLVLKIFMSIWSWCWVYL